jgi:hypothetical protein
MTQTDKYMARLGELKEGELSVLRRSGGLRLDAGLSAFDLFTGLWWPLRQESPKTPQRWCAWLVAKLYGACPFPPSERSLGAAVGALEPPPVRRGPGWDAKDRDRFRQRFDALLVCPAQDVLLEPHLRWCLRQIHDRGPRARAINWAELLDDLWRWGRLLDPANRDDHQRLAVHQRRCNCQEGHTTVQEVWACEYLRAVRRAKHDQPEGGDHAETH